MQPVRKKIVIVGATSAVAEHCPRQWLECALIMMVIRHLPRTIFNRMDI